MSDFGSSDFSDPDGFDDYSDYYEDNYSDGDADSNLHIMSTLEFNIPGTWSRTQRQTNSQLSSASEFSFGISEENAIVTLPSSDVDRDGDDEYGRVKTLLELACLKAARSFTFDHVFSLKILLSETIWKRFLRLQFPRTIEDMYSALAIYSSEGILDKQGLVVKVLQQIGCVLYGEVRDGRGMKAKIHCLGDRGKITKSRCSSCKSGFCAHVQKVISYYLTKLGNKHIQLPISHDLNQLNRDQLQHLVQKILSHNKCSNLLLLTKRIADECTGRTSITEIERDYSLGSASSMNRPHWYFKKQLMTEKIERIFQPQKEGHLSSFLPAEVGHFRLGLNSELEKLKKTNFLSIVEKWKCVDSFFGGTVAHTKEFLSNVLKLLQNGDLTCIPLLEMAIDVIIALRQRSELTSSMSTNTEVITVQPSLNPSDKENHALNSILLLIISFVATKSIEDHAKTGAIVLFRKKLEAALTELNLSYKNSPCAWDGLAFMDRTIANLNAIPKSEFKLDETGDFVVESEHTQRFNLSSLVFLYRAQCEIDSVYPPLFSKIVSCLDANLNTIQYSLKRGKVPWRGEFWAVCFLISQIPDGELRSCLLEVALMNFVSLPNPTYDDLCWLKFVLSLETTVRWLQFDVNESSLAYIRSDERPGYIFFEALARQASGENLIGRLNCFLQWLSPVMESDKEATMEKLIFIFNAKWFEIVQKEESDEICEKQLDVFVEILSLCDSSVSLNDIYRNFLVPHFDSQLVSDRLPLFVKMTGKMLKRSLPTRTDHEKENLLKAESASSPTFAINFDFSIDFSLLLGLQNSYIASKKLFYGWLYQDGGPLDRLTLCEALQIGSTGQMVSSFSTMLVGEENLTIIALADDVLKSVVPFRNKERSKWTFDEFFACPIVLGQIEVLSYIKEKYESLDEEPRSLFAFKLAKILTNLRNRHEPLANTAIEIIQKYVDELQDVPANTGTFDSSHNIVMVLTNVVEFQLEGAKKGKWARQAEISRLVDDIKWQFFYKAAKSKKKALSIAFKIVIRNLMEHDEFAEVVETIKNQTTDEYELEKLFLEENIVLKCFSDCFIKTKEKAKFGKEVLRKWLDN